jgi:hypothetical protein
MFGALDLASGKMVWRTRQRKRWIEFLDFLKVLRDRFGGRLYVIVDNFAPHRRREVREWCDDHDVELVFLPTYASWLNWIEAESPPCATSHSTAPTTPPTQNRPKRSGTTCGGVTATPNRNATSPSTRRSETYPDPITWTTLHDKALVSPRGSHGFSVTHSALTW